MKEPEQVEVRAEHQDYIDSSKPQKDSLVQEKIIATHMRINSQTSAAAASSLSRTKLLEAALIKAPRLVIKVISSNGQLEKGTTLNVNPLGIEGSLRKAMDGFTYFGMHKRLQKETKKSEIINDYIIPSIDKDSDDKHRGRHFQIEYNLERNVYQIKDLGNGYGAFVKIVSLQIMKDNHLYSMGDSFLIINLLNEEIGESEVTVHPKLRIKIFAGPSNGEIFYFNPTSEVIRIGRLNNCEIPIEDGSLSKYQAHVTFNPEKGWILEDGLDGKGSTNGTWLYLSEECDIYPGLIFKAHQTLFSASLIKPPQ